jgi:protease-4
MFRNLGISGAEKIVVLDIKGVITDSKPVIDRITKLKDDKTVKAFVVRIDSPGGSVAPSQEIYEELIKLRETKTVVASMGSVAASGGYYIACAADKIFANPGSITGSIGVIIESANIEELIKKIGLKSVVIKSGKYKDILSPTRQLTDDDRILIQGVVDNILGQFIDAVSLGRGLDRAKVAKIADGRLFSGEQAKDKGLVDELGNLQDAIKAAGDMAGIQTVPDVIYPRKERLSLIEYFIDESSAKIYQMITDNFLMVSFR